MKRDADMDALAEAIQQAQADRPSWLARLARRFLAKAVGPAVFAVALSIGLVLVGVDLSTAFTVLLWSGPFILVAVASFVAHAWRQNVGLTYAPAPSQSDLAAEPGQVAQPDLASEVANSATEVARPAQLPTVTVTVLPAPLAALPQAVGQAAPIHYAAEEETRG